MTNEKMIEEIRNDFIKYCRNNKLIVPFFSKKVNRVVYEGVTIALKTLSTNHKKEIEEVKNELDGFRLNVVLGLDVNYDVYKENDIIRAVNKALTSSTKEIEYWESKVTEVEKDWAKKYDDLCKVLRNVKHQLQTQRDDMDKFIRLLEIDLKLMLKKGDKSAVNKLSFVIEHLKQKPKGDD